MLKVIHRNLFVAVGIVGLLLITMSGISLGKQTGNTGGGTAAPDVVMEWNMAMLDMIKLKNISNQFGNRTMAMVHIAMFDAINGIQPEYTQFLVSMAHPMSISPQAAAAAAAYTILSTLYPAEQAAFESLYRQQLSRLSDHPILRFFAVRYGERIARAVLEWRENDGAAQAGASSASYLDGAALGEWRRTTPSMQPMLPGWGQVTPFAMTGGDQFRLLGPPPLESYEYARDYNEVMVLGAKGSDVRTDEQKDIALFRAGRYPADVEPRGAGTG